nr:hypothetical protein [uncultured bacterium]
MLSSLFGLHTICILLASKTAMDSRFLGLDIINALLKSEVKFFRWLMRGLKKD